MLEGKSLRASASEVGKSLRTSFNWRHKILAAIKSLQGGISFSGIVEADELLMKYSEKGRKFRSRKEYEIAKIKKLPIVDVVVMTDREGNVLFIQLGRKKVTYSQIRDELSHRVTDSNLICVKQKKVFKKAEKGTKSKKVVVYKTQISRGVYSVQVVDKHINDFKVWLRRFRGVDTKYMQSYLIY